MIDLSFLEHDMRLVEKNDPKFSNKKSQFILCSRINVKAYHVDIVLSIESVTDTFKKACDSAARELAEAAAEFIKMNNVDSAKRFILFYLEIDIKKAGFKLNSIPKINIHHTIAKGEWFYSFSLGDMA